MLKKSRLGIIVPCYNEELSIPSFTEELTEFISFFYETMPTWDLNILFVDNNSKDSSKSRIQEILTMHKECGVVDCVKQGYGAALKFGFSQLEADYYAFLDLDNTYPLKDVVRLLVITEKNSIDLMFGARLHNNSKISIIRGFGNRIYVKLLRILLNSNLSDVCSGMRIFPNKNRNEILALASDDLSFSIELTSYAVIKNWKLAELPILYRDRTGQSKLSLVRDGFKFLMVILKAKVNHL